MDRVRFGRALGYGARHAVKTLTQAGSAAAAPNPRPSTTRSATASSSASRPQPTAPRANQPPQPQKTAIRAQHVGQLGRSLWKPFARYSSSLLLQVTGTFFALIATYFGLGLWKARGAIHAAAGSSDARMLYLYAAGFLLFAYFTISSFIRASKR